LAQIGAFEKLVDEQFLNPPADQKGSIDSVWSRLLGKAKSEIVKQKVIEKLKANGLLDEESEN
jgi:rRNA-processing protein FCF1